MDYIKKAIWGPDPKEQVSYFLLKVIPFHNNRLTQYHSIENVNNWYVVMVVNWRRV